MLTGTMNDLIETVSNRVPVIKIHVHNFGITGSTPWWDGGRASMCMVDIIFAAVFDNYR